MNWRRIEFSWKKEKEILEQKDYSYRDSGCIENVWRTGFVALQALQIIYRATNWNKNPPVAFGFSKETYDLCSYGFSKRQKTYAKSSFRFSPTSKPVVSCFQSFRGIISERMSNIYLWIAKNIMFIYVRQFLFRVWIGEQIKPKF